MISNYDKLLINYEPKTVQDEAVMCISSIPESDDDPISTNFITGNLAIAIDKLLRGNIIGSLYTLRTKIREQYDIIVKNTELIKWDPIIIEKYRPNEIDITYNIKDCTESMMVYEFPIIDFYIPYSSPVERDKTIKVPYDLWKTLIADKDEVAEDLAQLYISRIQLILHHNDWVKNKKEYSSEDIVVYDEEIIEKEEDEE